MHHLLIVDDHPLYRMALRQTIAAALPGARIDEAGDLAEAQALLAAAPDADLVLLDLQLPGTHGLLALSELRAAHPAVAVAILSGHDDPRTVRQALASLSPQQLKVLQRVAEGRLNKQIADELGIQERTVKAHLTVVFEKLGVRNRTQAGVLLSGFDADA